MSGASGHGRKCPVTAFMPARLHRAYPDTSLGLSRSFTTRGLEEDLSNCRLGHPARPTTGRRADTRDFIGIPLPSEDAQGAQSGAGSDKEALT